MFWEKNMAFAHMVLLMPFDGQKKSPDRNKFDPGIALFYPNRIIKPFSIHKIPAHHPGRSSDFRIALLTTPSQQKSQWHKCGVRPRLQRWARPQFSWGSLLSSIKSTWNILKAYTIPSPISISVFFALKTHNILYAEINCEYYILCAVKSKNKFLILAEVLLHKHRFIVKGKFRGWIFHIRATAIRRDTLKPDKTETLANNQAKSMTNPALDNCLNLQAVPPYGGSLIVYRRPIRKSRRLAYLHAPNGSALGVRSVWSRFESS